MCAPFAQLTKCNSNYTQQLQSPSPTSSTTINSCTSTKLNYHQQNLAHTFTPPHREEIPSRSVKIGGSNSHLKSLSIPLFLSLSHSRLDRFKLLVEIFRTLLLIFPFGAWRKFNEPRSHMDLRGFGHGWNPNAIIHWFGFFFPTLKISYLVNSWVYICIGTHVWVSKQLLNNKCCRRENLHWQMISSSQVYTSLNSMWSKVSSYKVCY